MKMGNAASSGESKMDIGNAIRISGRVKRAFPDKGYIWIAGEDEVDYFGHATHVLHGTALVETWVGQPCTFIPHANGPDGKGPFAEAILLG
jgi:hypothetical protein